MEINGGVDWRDGLGVTSATKFLETFSPDGVGELVGMKAVTVGRMALYSDSSFKIGLSLIPGF